jgi:two-component system chemotaxis sensor kinase CheA
VQVDLREFRAAYLAEVDEHLAATNAGLLAVDAANRDGKAAPRELRELMRLLHTIKGLSAMVGIEPIVNIAHRMESVLRAADRAGGVLGDRALEAMIAGARAIESRVRAVANNQPVAEATRGTLEALEAVEAETEHSEPGTEAGAVEAALDPEVDAKLTASEREQLSQGADAGRHAVRIDFAPAPAKAERGLTITTLRERLGAIGDIVRVLPMSRPTSEAAPGGLLFVVVLVTDASLDAVADAASVPSEDVREILGARSLPLGPTSPAASAAADGDRFTPPPSDDGAHVDPQRPGVLRVDVARIDDTIEKLSGLIVTRSRLARAASKLRESGADTRDLEGILVDNARQLRDLRAAILRVRMIPISTVLDRLPLVIRGLGRSTGKQVRLSLEGGGAELDKTVAERIFPALVHLLRNSVDHGVETPAERARAGKPEHATITVTSSSRNNRQIEIRIEDDGRGVDRARVAAKAGREVPTDDSALLDMLCQPGLSTRDEVDTTSGRGVGMDIVRKIVVDGLGGELLLETKPGVGTTFVIRVPLTIAIVDSFMLRCGGERFVVPVPVVEEIIVLDPARIVHGPRVGNRDTRFFARRGETVPVVDLARALGLFSDARGGSEARETSAQALVVRRGHDDPVAFAIDRVLGQQETVVRPLVDPLVAVTGISGSTDLGDGRATLVLDLVGLSGQLGRARGAAA